MIYDANKKLVGLGDFRPTPKKLGKGDQLNLLDLDMNGLSDVISGRVGNFTLRFQIRHDQIDMLEKLQDVEILLEKNLSKPINLPIYSTLNDALTYAMFLPQTVCYPTSNRHAVMEASFRQRERR